MTEMEILKAKVREVSAQRLAYEKAGGGKKTPPNPDNPMSPYCKATSPKLDTVSDWINNYPFHAIFTENYTHIPEAVLQGELPAIYLPTHNDEQSHGVVTIAGMLDLIDMNESFTLLDDKDLPIIKRICTDYLKQVPENLPVKENLQIERIRNLVKIVEDSIARSGVKEGGIMNLQSLLKLLRGK